MAHGAASCFLWPQSGQRINQSGCRIAHWMCALLCASLFMWRHCKRSWSSRVLMSVGGWYSWLVTMQSTTSFTGRLAAVLEPRDWTSSDDRRPDELTMIPWSEGRCLAWDATVSDSLAGSHLNRTVHASGAAA